MSVQNFFAVLAGLFTTQFVANPATSTPPSTASSRTSLPVISEARSNQGCRQVGGSDANATLPWVTGRFYQQM
jgi:hypothetical protein